MNDRHEASGTVLYDSFVTAHPIPRRSSFVSATPLLSTMWTRLGDEEVRVPGGSPSPCFRRRRGGERVQVRQAKHLFDRCDLFHRILESVRAEHLVFQIFERVTQLIILC